MLNGSTFEIRAFTLLNNNLYWFGSTGAFVVNIEFVNKTTLAAVHAVGHELIYGEPVGYNQDPGLSVPVPGESCQQLITEWRAGLDDVLVSGGITPSVTIDIV